MKLLLEYSNQLDLNITDRWKNTPLHLACEDDGQVEVGSSNLLFLPIYSRSVPFQVIKLLLDAGADKSAKNKDEKTPLEMAKPELQRVLREFLT